ncbi:RNA-guided endonuclease TnpB family protein [Anabaena sp. 90]|uniref:RNA-guided endonuclease TnpB family protein n=1 Tax=Anabaena sp. 90 TaxID=46234 RepID=UPI00130EC097|nr:RNA-guided endonuclease TnpB family protein [Anabaena sp. 90]
MESQWLWNLGLELLIEYHQFEYYKWLEKKASEKGISLENIDRYWLRFPKHSAWSLPMIPNEQRMQSLLTEWKESQEYKYFGLGGATCQIAFIDKDRNYQLIPKRLLPSEPRLQKHGQSVKSISRTLEGYLTKTRCNVFRQSQNLPPLQIDCGYMGGLLNHLANSWAAYIDPQRRDSHIPKWKKEAVKTFSCLDTERIKLIDDQLFIPGVKSGIKFVNKNHKRLKEGDEIRSVVIKNNSSGWYVCLTVANKLEVELRQKQNSIKKETDDDKKREIKLKIDHLKIKLDIRSRQEAGIKPSNKATGIDPGVKAMVATDGEALIKPPIALKLQEAKLTRLQRKLSRHKTHSKNFNKTTAKLARVHENIRRNRTAYHHKVSTYLIRNFGAIAWEDTQHKNLTRKPKPKLRADGKGYAKNGARAKSRLNRNLLDVALGGLREKTKSKMTTYRGEGYFILTKPHYSSKKCYCCGEKGNRRTQSDFYCTNPQCRLHGVKQQADVNAARNHLLNSGFLQSGKYRLWDWYQQNQEDTPLGAGNSVATPGEFKPVGETLSSGDVLLGETETLRSKSMRQEADTPAPSPEYGDQLYNFSEK